MPRAGTNFKFKQYGLGTDRVGKHFIKIPHGSVIPQGGVLVRDILSQGKPTGRKSLVIMYAGDDTYGAPMVRRCINVKRQNTRLTSKELTAVADDKVIGFYDRVSDVRIVIDGGEFPLDDD